MLTRFPANQALQQYALVTANYWAFTLTDGALRMLVVLYFHQLGYGALDIALLFLFYEFFGVVTNLVGGWLGARIGLNRTMNIGLALQVGALLMLTVPVEYLSVAYVMVAQALSGIAKDLNKMSAKSSVKWLFAEAQKGLLFRWVALLTGSKNALKGVGFFLGAALLAWLGFKGAMLLMAGLLAVIFVGSLILLQPLGKTPYKPKFKEIFSNNAAINYLAAARMFLFGARDIWFVVALPVFMAETLGWPFMAVGGFMACWIIGYGLVQGLAPKLLSASHLDNSRKLALIWLLPLVFIPAAIAFGLGLNPAWVLVAGLLVFAACFAVNSSLHSFLIVDFARTDGVSMDVGFYYMANAMGRLLGTVLGGWLFQQYGGEQAGLQACLWGAAAMLALAWLLSTRLPGDRR